MPEPVRGLPVHRTVAPHDHAVAIYDTDEDLADQLTSYLEEGLGREEATAFVHSFDPDSHTDSFLGGRRADYRTLQDQRRLHRAFYRDAFEREDHIAQQHVAEVVGSLLKDVRQHKLRGLRIFVDASKNYLGSGRAKEWFAFESWLGPRLESEAALVCAYRRQDVRDPAVLAEIVRTHAYQLDTRPN